MARIAIVYDCLYPHTVGGGERWYAALAEQLAHKHQVTYVTRRQWPGLPDAPRGVRVVAVSKGGDLYSGGRRSTISPIFFGLGVFWHFLTHRRSYDAVYISAFPYFSLPAVRIACACSGVRIVVDWLEVWSKDYWMQYLGKVGGHIGLTVQQLCIILSKHATVVSRLHQNRLAELGHRGQRTLLYGLGGPTTASTSDRKREQLVIFVGRHIPEKRAATLPSIILEAMTFIPDLKAIIFGDGPEWSTVFSNVVGLGLRQSIDCPGFVDYQKIEEAMDRAMCLVLPSSREGFGLVIVEAAAHGLPSIVVTGADNAATDLIEHGVNGLIVSSVNDIPQAINLISQHPMTESTREWFERNKNRFDTEQIAKQIEGCLLS